LNALTAEKVFGWKNVHKHSGELIGKKQDKARRWRMAKVPSYCTDLVHAYTIDERILSAPHPSLYVVEVKLTASSGLGENAYR
jgi:hypothetical protein